VPSSVIQEFAYDATAQALSITFVSGKTYVYDRVPPSLYDAFAAAGSKGEFFNRYIRDHYAYALMGPGAPRRHR
jgi:KTSC domain